MALSKGATSSEVSSLLYRFPYGRSSSLFLTSLKLSSAPASVEHPTASAWEWRLLGWPGQPLHGGSAAWLPCDPFRVPDQEEPCVFTIPAGESSLLLCMVSTSCLAVVSPVLSFSFSPHPREGRWASPLHREMANSREKVPKTNLTSRRQALGAVFTYGGKTHGICPHPDVLLVSFSVLSSLSGLINFLNEVGWFLINPEGLSGPVSSLSLWLIFVLSFKSGKVTLNILLPWQLLI